MSAYRVQLVSSKVHYHYSEEHDCAELVYASSLEYQLSGMALCIHPIAKIRYLDIQKTIRDFISKGIEMNSAAGMLLAKWGRMEGLHGNVFMPHWPQHLFPLWQLKPNAQLLFFFQLGIFLECISRSSSPSLRPSFSGSRRIRSKFETVVVRF